MKKKEEPTPVIGELILYQTKDGKTKVEVRLQDETVWLTQKLMAELFKKDVRTVNEHIKNIFAEGELVPESVIRNFRITAADGKNYDTAHYNLDVIISVGYRVKSLRGTQFRIWATQRLREYLIKGFTLMMSGSSRPGAAATSVSCWPASGTSVPPKRYSGARCWTSTQPASTTPPMRSFPGSSLPPFRTRCTGPRMATLPPR